MSESPPIAPAPESEPVQDFGTDTDAQPLRPKLDPFSKFQVEQAIAKSLESIPPVKMDEVSRRSDLREVKRLHDADLFKTQDHCHDVGVNNGNVLVFVRFPESRSTTSCRFTSFNTGTVRLTYNQVLSTGSELLEGLLVNERHQRRAKKAAAPLPEGVEYVLDLSPTTDENDYTIALQLLSTPHAVQLWYRSMALGASPLAVAGHDDVCTCLMPFDEPYPFPTPPDSIKILDGNVCILDTKEWPLENDRKIDDFCTTRWAANTLRLFRAISMPPGRKDLVIDSAPRMWTLVGLFAKLEMTNYDILRDEVVAWFNADMNHAFVELCPEETLHIGLILKSPLLTEPAFRILVNERALEVAGGQPRSQPTTTLFGRRCSDFTGTDVAESISRMIEHASCAMTERYKLALDGLCGDNALDVLDIPEWQELRALDNVIPNGTKDINTHRIRVAYNQMMDLIRQMFRDSVDRILQGQCENLPFQYADAVRNDHFSLHGITIAQIEEKRAFSVPKEELTTQTFSKVFNSLNWYQRALTPIIWHGLTALANDMPALVNKDKVERSLISFRAMILETREGDELFGHTLPKFQGILSHGLTKVFFRSILTKLKAYVRPLITRDEHSFVYTMTPHLPLALNDHELNFLRLADDESTFQTEAPETDLGPSGPGPAFHTGQTVPSVSDLDFEKLAVESIDGVSTMGRSMAAQDGISTVYDRKRVLARSVAPSVASEQFTDGDSSLSADYMDAEYKVPADHQCRGLTLAQIVEQMDDEDDLDSLDFELDEDSDYDTVMGDDDGRDEAEPDHADRAMDHLNTNMTSTTSSDPNSKETEDEASWSEDFDDSDFEVIKTDEPI